MFVSLPRAAAVSISNTPIGYDDPDHLIAPPGTSFVRLEIGHEMARRIAIVIDERGAEEGFNMEERSMELVDEFCIWGDTLRPARDTLSWEVAGSLETGSGYLQIMLENAREGDDALDGTLPPPSEPSIGQLMDCADQLKRLLALASLKG